MQSRRVPRERGAILIMTALFMIVALMMVAMAVDMGQMRSKRAQFQHVADAASLYGGYQVNNGISYAVAEVSVRDFVRQNLGLALSAWDGCTDVKHLPSYTPGNQCISFDYGPSDPADPASPRQYFSRVRIPPQDVDFAELYDCFTIVPIIELEELGFVETGAGGAFFEEGHARIGGKLPVCLREPVRVHALLVGRRFLPARRRPVVTRGTGARYAGSCVCHVRIASLQVKNIAPRT